MSESDYRKGYPFPVERPPSTILVLGQKKSNTIMTDHTEFPPSNRTNPDELARSVALLSNEVAVLKRRLVTYEETFNQLFELLTSSDRRIARLEREETTHDFSQNRIRKTQSSLGELEQCGDWSMPSNNLGFSESTMAGKSRTSRESVEIMKNAISLNNRQLEQVVQRLESLESLGIASRLDQLESAVQSEVNILKLL